MLGQLRSRSYLVGSAEINCLVVTLSLAEPLGLIVPLGFALSSVVHLSILDHQPVLINFTMISLHFNR